MNQEAGFTLFEVIIALMIMGIGLGVLLPGVILAHDHAALESTAWGIVTDLRNQQMIAQKKQYFQELRFLLVGTKYYLYDGKTGKYTLRSFMDPTSYFEGYLHLPQSTVRFSPIGNINESGQILLTDPEGGIKNIVLYMQYGDLRVTTNPLSN